MEEKYVYKCLVIEDVLDDLKNISETLKKRCDEQRGFNFTDEDFALVVESVEKKVLHQNSMYCLMRLKLPGMVYDSPYYYDSGDDGLFKWESLAKTEKPGYLIEERELEILTSYLKKFNETKDSVIQGIGVRLGRDLTDILQRTLHDGTYYLMSEVAEATITEPVVTTVKDEVVEHVQTHFNKLSDESEVTSSAEREVTNKEFMDAFLECRNIFVVKLKEYGPSWRIFRPQSVTDQLFIKGTRIRSLQETGISAVGEGTYTEFCALVNYGIIALIQLECGYSNTYDMTQEQALEMYDKYMKIAFDLMVKKNHDYDEAWRSMRIFSYTDFVLVKLARIKQIEDNGFDSGTSEGVDSNYLDIINYSIFGLIKLTEDKNNG